MQSYDPSPVTDSELALAMQSVEDAAVVFDELLALADDRQRSAILGACPFVDWQDARIDYGAWLAVVLDGTTGLRLNRRTAGAA